MGTITVNGRSLEEHVSEAIGREVAEVRESENRFKSRPIVSKHRGNISGTKTSAGEVVYVAGQRETHVIICGLVFPWLEKGPTYVRSGFSILGGRELDADGNVKCHECGKWFGSVGHHARIAHEMSTKEYRILHGLRARSSLSSPKISAKLAARNRLAQHGARLFSAGSAPRPPTRIAGRDSFAGFAELANLRGKCAAQTKAKIVALAEQLGRAPKVRELKSVGLERAPIERLLGMKWRDVLGSIGLQPRRYIRSIIHTQAASA